MQHGAPLVWIPRAMLEQCALEATAFYPRETGGAFMGYWCCDHTQAVITTLISAGPGARHRLTTFEPDQKWQLDKIKQHYIASGRRQEYLGDWHTHPDASSGELSATDRAVLARIIATPKARAPRPISVVFYGRRSSWKPTAWVAHMGHKLFFQRRSLTILQASLQMYEQ